MKNNDSEHSEDMEQEIDQAGKQVQSEQGQSGHLFGEQIREMFSSTVAEINNWWSNATINQLKKTMNALEERATNADRALKLERQEVRKLKGMLAIANEQLEQGERFVKQAAAEKSALEHALDVAGEISARKSSACKQVEELENKLKESQASSSFFDAQCKANAQCLIQKEKEIQQLLLIAENQKKEVSSLKEKLDIEKSKVMMAKQQGDIFKRQSVQLEQRNGILVKENAELSEKLKQRAVQQPHYVSNQLNHHSQNIPRMQPKQQQLQQQQQQQHQQHQRQLIVTQSKPQPTSRKRNNNNKADPRSKADSAKTRRVTQPVAAKSQPTKKRAAPRRIVAPQTSRLEAFALMPNTLIDFEDEDNIYGQLPDDIQ